MMEYYYILSSLPFLKFEHKPPLLFPHFVEQCTMWLPADELQQLQMSRLDIESIHHDMVTEEALQRWVAFENTLRNELVGIRAENLGVPANGYLREEPGFDPSAVPLVRQAVQMATPYEIEVELLRIRWGFLTDLETGHYFDLAALTVYGLKLQILERLSLFDEQKGHHVFNMIYERPFDEQ